MKWMPIESAPKASFDLLLFCEDTEEQFVGFRAGGGKYLYAQKDGVSFLCTPTHWRHLPEPPK